MNTTQVAAHNWFNSIDKLVHKVDPAATAVISNIVAHKATLYNVPLKMSITVFHDTRLAYQVHSVTFTGSLKLAKQQVDQEYKNWKNSQL